MKLQTSVSGRATIERNGNRQLANRNSSQPIDKSNNNEMRITSNPLNYNYVEPDDAIRENGNVMVTSFDNPNSIELPSQNEKSRTTDDKTKTTDDRTRTDDKARVIDSTTYCKKPSRHARQHSGDGHWQ